MPFFAVLDGSSMRATVDITVSNVIALLPADCHGLQLLIHRASENIHAPGKM